MSFLDRFSVLLLDMNGTFVFGHDRLGPDEDFFATYVREGGRHLDREGVASILTHTIGELWRAYQDPARVDDFPSVAETLRRIDRGMSHTDCTILESVVALHELGSVPPLHEQCLRELATTHTLGIVSNLWSRPDRWISAFQKAGLLALFKTLVFSSRDRSIKPSKRLFQKALAAVPRDASVLFVGDSLERDIIPAKHLGLATAWIAPQGSAAGAADVIVESLLDLKQIGTAPH